MLESFLSLQVECEYEESDLKHAKDLRSWYTVTNPPAVVARGAMRVQMRLATGTRIFICIFYFFLQIQQLKTHF